jgi:hypothetical protein
MAKVDGVDAAQLHSMEMEHLEAERVPGVNQDGRG